MDIIADLVIGEIEMMGLLLLNAVRQQLAQTMHEEMATFFAQSELTDPVASMESILGPVSRFIGSHSCCMSSWKPWLIGSILVY